MSCSAFEQRLPANLGFVVVRVYGARKAAKPVHDWVFGLARLLLGNTYRVVREHFEPVPVLEPLSFGNLLHLRLNLSGIEIVVVS